MMKKMNKKGFTLIELLAIIVILAIIAVITVPIILNIIENAREGARKNSVIGYGKAVELAYTQDLYNKNISATTTVTGASTNVVIDGTTTPLKVDYEGDKVECTTAVITSGKLELTSCKVAGSTETYNYKNGKACKSGDNSCTLN